MSTDISSITIGLKTMIVVGIFIISITITSVTGYITLRDDVDDLASEVKEIQVTLDDNNLELIAYKITDIFKKLEENSN